MIEEKAKEKDAKIVATSGIADGCMRSDSGPIAVFDFAKFAEEKNPKAFGSNFIRVKRSQTSDWVSLYLQDGFAGNLVHIIFNSIDGGEYPLKENDTEGSEMATKRSVGTLKEADLKGKKVFVRVDLNVPLDDNLNITDDTRVRVAVPIIKYLMGHGAKVIISSHLGRPKGVTPKYSLKPLVPRLSELLGIEVNMANDCISEEVQIMVAEIPEGDLYVNDAFGTAHRAHTSTEGVAKYLKPSIAGFLMQKELDYLVGAVSNPKKPFAAIVGGSKVSSKIGVIESLLEKVDMLLLGGDLSSGKGVTTIIRGGDSVAAVEKVGLANKMSHISTGAGASLELLEGKSLPGVLALDDA
ncbi:hypothetical protein TEA_010682 [Camellia sinensis var. sinensis]|uniref:Phosphoglycerate kinase n=1 Tax=Camellia sinensis var. sinensis TaxID=542762 RepID=A0A4S4E5G1_CAMSN|nr:hypothetical protein TEA_010682 [Camellia sinensis var. sinensis]